MVGVRTGDKGIDKHGQTEAELPARQPTAREGDGVLRGPARHAAKQLGRRARPRRGRDHPQVYATGVKELWEMPAGRVPKGRVIHTMGFPLDTHTFGGVHLRHGRDTLGRSGSSSGSTTGDPTLDPHEELQQFKTHPWSRALLEGGKVVATAPRRCRRAATTRCPSLSTDGVLFVGDSAGF